MSSYFHNGTDLDGIFEPRLDGDPKVPEAVGLVTAGVDPRDKYVPLSMGARYVQNVGYSHRGIDLRDLFAFKGSVARFSGELPWDTVVPVTGKIYRQPSRPLITPIYSYVEVLANGQVYIMASTPNQHSNPAARSNTVLYELSSPPAWDDSTTPADADYEIRFDVVSNIGALPQADLAFGVWHRMDGTPASGRVTNIINYNHNTTLDGAQTQNCQVRISVRRSDYPDTIKTDGVIAMNISLTVLASLFTATAPYLADLSLIVSSNIPRDPISHSADYIVNTVYSVKGDGTLTTRRNIVNANGAGAFTEILNTPWRRGLTADDTTIDDFEVKFTSGLGVTTNGAVAWSPISANSNYSLAMVHTISNNLAEGAYTQASTGTLMIRQKSTIGYVATDNFVSGALKATTTFQLGAPIGPDWTGMSLPTLTNHRNVNLDYGRPNRWESAVVNYIMGISTSLTANNVIGRRSSQTTDNVANPTEPITTVDAVLTRITPVNWDPSEFEWRYRVLGGATDGADSNTWRGMSNAAYSVQVGSSVNHGSGVGVYSDFADVAVDVRRIAVPAQTYTFTTRMESSVTLVANGPAWTSIVLPDHSTTVQASANQDYTTNSNYDVASSGYQIAVNDGGFNSYLNKHSYYGTDQVAGNISNIQSSRFTPTNWDVDDLEWKYDVESVTGPGAFITGYYLPGSALPPATWGNVTAMKYLAFFTGLSTPRTEGTVVTAVGKVKISVRVKSQPTMTYTYPTVTFTNTVQYVAPLYTLWPRADYQNWAGTYSHTSSHQLVSQPLTDLAFDLLAGNTHGMDASWDLVFSTDGKWYWSGNGLIVGDDEGPWAAAPVTASNFSIRQTVTSGYDYTTNITSTWAKLTSPKNINVYASRPPAGEPNNFGRYTGVIDIRDDVSGNIVSTTTSLRATSHRD